MGVKLVRLVSGRRLRAKVEVHRAVGVLLQLLVERAERKARRVKDEARRLETVDRDRPELSHRHLRRNVQAVVVPTLQHVAAIVLKRVQVEAS